MSNDVTTEPDSILSLAKPATEVQAEDTCQEGISVAVGTKTLELHLSTDALEKLLKDGKLERQSDELYQVMEEASKAVEQMPDTEVMKEEDKETPSSQLNASAVTPVVVKRKRGRPRKETYLGKNTNIAQSLMHGNQTRRVKGKNLTSSAQSESIEEVEYDTDSEIKPKRSRKTKILHDDYVADFNTSDEEEGGKIFRRFAGRGRGKGRGKRKNCEFPEAFNDFFSSCNEFFGRKAMLEEESIDHSIFDDFEGDDELYLPNKSQSESSPKCKRELHDGLEGVIGPGGQTRVQIVNTGDTTVIDDEENFIYNIITTTGAKESITPLVVPKVAGDVSSKGLDGGSLLSSVKQDDDDEGTVDSIMQGDGTDFQTTSKKTQNKHQDKDRALYRQVASLKQKYYQALQELKKKPQVSTFADLVYSAASFLTDDQLMFFTMQLKSGCPNMPGVKYVVCV